MNRGQARGSRRGGRGSANRGQGRGNHQDDRHSQPTVRRSPQRGAGVYGPSANDFSGNKEGSSKGEMGSPQEMSPCSFSKNPEHYPTLSSEYRKEWRPSDKKDLFSNDERLKDGSNSTESMEVNSNELKCSVASDSGHKGPKVHYLHLHKGQRVQRRETPSKSTGDSETSLPSRNLSQNLHKGVQRMQIGETPSKRTGDSETYEPSANDFSGNKEGSLKGEMGSPQEMFPRSFSKNPEHKPTSSPEYRKEWRPSYKKDLRSNAERLKEGSNSTESTEVNSKELKSSDASDSGHKGDFSSLSNLSQDLHEEAQRMQIGETPSKRTGDSETYLASKSEVKHGQFPIKSPLTTSGHQKPELSEHSAVDSPFDLCPTKAGIAVTLKPSLLVQNRERRNESKRSMEQPIEIVLQSGMILLKSFISPSDQIKIVKRCRDMGLGTGGFYQPGYRDGAKLNLKMMCLGKNWDPETSKYGDHRPHDGAKPPSIPIDFLRLVEDAIKKSHSFIRKNYKVGNCEHILPPVSPDICLVNFYSSTGRLGLHQDRDESEQSLRKCLPVVSFSIGDAAEFLYGDQRNVESANRAKLESGDVLIFGGESRHIFHGVASVEPNTAPKTLIEATNLRSGRLNLTFREY
ncbi:hypothetical protein M0R45_032199 [Rubus argutus]|uniref:DNA N(6)-methyladenine demethylase n=1 Tax=Rubus argutus TaxID=59490 RepID=A0AAW1WG74_RUBAR